jgi:hypothetical protein
MAVEDRRREGNCHGNLAAEKSRAFAGEKLAPSFPETGILKQFLGLRVFAESPDTHECMCFVGSRADAYRACTYDVALSTTGQLLYCISPFSVT